MTLEDIPTLVRFGRLYWNQMGPDIYGSVEDALCQMLEDGGEELRRTLRKELTFLAEGVHYTEWLAKARYDKVVIRELGGAFIMPEDIPILLTVLDGGGR